MFDHSSLTNQCGMLIDSNGIAAHLLLEPMPELRWQDIPLGFILNFINIIPHTLIWQTVECLWDLSVALPLPGPAQPAQERSREQLTDRLGLSWDLGEILFYGLHRGRESSWQACS